MENNLYEAIKKAGIQIQNHYSDLYFPVTPESVAILAQYPAAKRIATTFTNQVEGGLWYEVPFAFRPYWEERKSRLQLGQS